MSIPPQLIRVKRKRDDESPVTFLQFDEGAKRHRTGSNWVYQRRHADPQSPTEAPTRSFHDVKPVIHVSGPDGDAPRTKAKVAVKASDPTSIASTLNPVPADESKLAEPRRFHISKKMMMTATRSQSAIPGMKKKGRYGPAVFVERGRVKASQRASRALEAMRASATPSPDPQQQQDGTVAVDQKATEPRLKKPGVRSRTRSPMPDPNARAPLPASAMNPHNQDMSRITADMNDWVMKEIGANLQQMENEKRKAVQHRFKPKTPTKSYAERHPEVVAKAPEPNQMDTAMSDASDMDDDDWVIEEYVRVPAHAMMVNIAPADVGVLVLDGEEDNTLFFGPENDEDEELDEDDEDENAENYYTADYPEDEVESDDEYGRRPYGYRNGNASDDEEFDNMDYDDDDDGMVLEGDGDDDATMARIKNYVRRSHAFQ